MAPDPVAWELRRTVCSELQRQLKTGLDAFRAGRYAGWQGELGRAIHASEAALASIADVPIQAKGLPEPRSGRQEWLETLIDQF